MGKPLTEEHKAKIRAACKGKTNATSFKKGHISWTKGTKGAIKNPLKGKKMPQEWKDKISVAKKGRKPAWMDSPQAPEIWAKHLASLPRGEEHPYWKGGITPQTEVIRNSLQYKLWRKAVYERDGYACIECGDKTGGNLQADHIKPFSTHPELRFAIDNGRTLCISCHIKTPTYGGRQTAANRLI